MNFTPKLQVDLCFIIWDAKIQVICVFELEECILITINPFWIILALKSFVASAISHFKANNTLVVEEDEHVLRPLPQQLVQPLTSYSDF